MQVINQYEENEGERKTRYDVTILVNGLPLVHIELKKRGNAIREAFNQINRYQHDSFWAGDGLYQYVQLFVISNGTHTKYYSNTTRFQHIKDNAEKNAKKKKKRLLIALNSQVIGRMKKTVPSRTLWTLQKPFCKTYVA